MKVRFWSLAVALCPAWLLLFGSAKISYAQGHWEFQVTQSGTSTQSQSSVNWPEEPTYGAGGSCWNSAYAPLPQPDGSEYTVGPKSCEAKSSGTIQVKAIWRSVDWDGDGVPDEPAPTKLVVKEFSSCNIGGGCGPYAPSYTDIKATELTVENPIETSRTSADGNINSVGRRLTQINNSSRQTEVMLPKRQFKVSGKIENMPPWSGGYVTHWPTGVVNGSITYSVEEDTRTADISRGDAINETVDEEGNIHGDTIYSSVRSYSGSTTTGTVTVSVPHWLQFYAWLNGEWSDQLSFKWEPAFSGAYMYWNQWSIPFGNIEYFDGKPMGSATGQTSQVIYYTVKDQYDDYEAAPKYFLTIHDEIEGQSKRTKNEIQEHDALGSGSNGHAMVLNGPCPAKDARGHVSRTLVVNKSWSFNFGVALAEWFKLAGIQIGASYENQTGEEWTRECDLNAHLLEGYYVVLRQQDSFIKHIAEWWQFSVAGEDRVYDEYNQQRKHQASALELVSSDIFWSEPRSLEGEPYP